MKKLLWLAGAVIVLVAAFSIYRAFQRPEFVMWFMAGIFAMIVPALFARNPEKEKDLKQATREGRETKDGKAHGHGGENH